MTLHGVEERRIETLEDLLALLVVTRDVTVPAEYPCDIARQLQDPVGVGGLVNSRSFRWNPPTARWQVVSQPDQDHTVLHELREEIVQITALPVVMRGKNSLVA